eukprot:scaffold158535_cov23-Prasinocladus_malaysianus.AAC.1
MQSSMGYVVLLFLKRLVAVGCPCVPQHVDDLALLVVLGDVERRLAAVVPQADVGPVVQQRPHEGRVAEPRGVVHGGVPVDVFGVDVDPQLPGNPLHQVLVAPEGGLVQGRPARRLLHLTF